MRLIPLLFLSACGLFGKPTSDELVDAFLADHGGADGYLNCGYYVAGEQCMIEGYPDELLCMLDALDGCIPAYTTQETQTIEGGEILHTLIVYETDSGCGLASFYDDTGDEFAEDRGITQEECTSLEEGENACEPYGLGGCVEIDSW